MQLIAVVLCAPSTAERFHSASALLDYGFANYAVADSEKLGITLPAITVQGGTESDVRPTGDAIRFVVKKGNQDRVEYEICAEDKVKAPVEEGQKLGEILFRIDGEEVARRDLLAEKSVPRIQFLTMLLRMARRYLTM